MENTKQYNITFINSEMNNLAKKKLRLSYMKDFGIMVFGLSMAAVFTSCGPLESPVFAYNGSCGVMVVSSLLLFFANEQYKNCNKEIDNLEKKQKLCLKK